MIHIGVYGVGSRIKARKKTSFFSVDMAEIKMAQPIGRATALCHRQSGIFIAANLTFPSGIRRQNGRTADLRGFANPGPHHQRLSAPR
jgi:hypothetical protein